MFLTCSNQLKFEVMAGQWHQRLMGGQQVIRTSKTEKPSICTKREGFLGIDGGIWAFTRYRRSQYKQSMVRED